MTSRFSRNVCSPLSFLTWSSGRLCAFPTGRWLHFVTPSRHAMLLCSLRVCLRFLRRYSQWKRRWKYWRLACTNTSKTNGVASILLSSCWAWLNSGWTASEGCQSCDPFDWSVSHDIVCRNCPHSKPNDQLINAVSCLRCRPLDPLPLILSTITS